ncbi:MAG: hypothetical protein M3306_17725 [Actinomycetota bacterium]|nr:hypothetical protein [Actinomycetota bacterium]
MTDFVGRVDSVFTRQFAASIAAPAAARATALTVVDGDDLDPAGQVLTPWDGAVYDYTFDDDVTVTLSAPLATAAEEGETLVVWDPAKSTPVVDTIAHVAVLGVDNADDIVEARVSFPLIPLLPEGIRDEETAEAVTVRLDGSDYIVAEVLGQTAVIDGAMIDPSTVPPPATDGIPPGSNPAVTLRPGIGSMFVVWEPIENADPVTYDVYAVPAADAARLAAPPLATDLVGSSEGTGAGFRALPDGTVLSHTSSYAVAVYARDKDGQCPVSATPVTGSPAQVNSEDLALNAVTTDHLTANNALFIALQAEDIVGVTITGSTITGVEIEGGHFRTDAGDRRIEIGPVSTETGGGRIDFYSPDLDRPATIIASTQGTLGITSGGDLDTGGVAQSASLSLTGVGPFSTRTGAALEASAINLNTSGSYSVEDGTIALDADSKVIISAPSIIIGGQTFGDTGWIDIALASGYEAGETGVPQYRVKNGYVTIRGSVQQTATGTLALNSSPGHTIGTLPVAARPLGADIVTLTPPQNPAANQARLFVWTNGTVKVYLTGSGAAAYVALGVVYPI